ncbi:uncharacterized protein LOC131328529 [Rhododendron vialii]|uniref:uncharacterized protein LOC131328529 n=1 Tax=Rhododendron vialii TaxID=182163 RepID=UPI00265E7E90|nr:uncharacterized protein LOC131328529 [Rhododendron vialii]
MVFDVGPFEFNQVKGLDCNWSNGSQVKLAELRFDRIETDETSAAFGKRTDFLRTKTEDRRLREAAAVQRRKPSSLPRCCVSAILPGLPVMGNPGTLSNPRPKKNIIPSWTRPLGQRLERLQLQADPASASDSRGEMDLLIGNLNPNGDDPNPNLIPNLNRNGGNSNPNEGNPNPNPNLHPNPNPNPEPNQEIPSGEMRQVTQAIQCLGECTDNQIAQLMMMITGVARRLLNPNPNANPNLNPNPNPNPNPNLIPMPNPNPNLNLNPNPKQPILEVEAPQNTEMAVVLAKITQLEQSVARNKKIASTGFDINKLCLFLNAKLLEKFRPIDFAKFDGTGDPKAHLTGYIGALSMWGVERDAMA